MTPTALSAILTQSPIVIAPVELLICWTSEEKLLLAYSKSADKESFCVPYKDKEICHFGGIQIAHYVNDEIDLFLPTDEWGSNYCLGTLSNKGTITHKPHQIPKALKSLQAFPKAQQALNELLEVIEASASINDISSYLLANAENWGLIHTSLDRKPWKIKGHAASLEELIKPGVIIPPAPLGIDFHASAKKRVLDKIPKEYFTQENLLRKNAFGNTVFHEAAAVGCLDQMPLELLTAKNMMRRNAAGEIVLEIAAGHGYLDQLPREILTLENLLKRDKEGITSLHYAALEGNLHKVPEEHLTEENLLQRDGDGDSVIDLAIAEGKLDQMLGIELSEKTCLEYKNGIPEEWFNRNREICAERKRLKEQLSEEVAGNDIEIF